MIDEKKLEKVLQPDERHTMLLTEGSHAE